MVDRKAQLITIPIPNLSLRLRWAEPNSDFGFSRVRRPPRLLRRPCRSIPTRGKVRLRPLTMLTFVSRRTPPDSWRSSAPRLCPRETSPRDAPASNHLSTRTASGAEASRLRSSSSRSPNLQSRRRPPPKAAAVSPSDYALRRMREFSSGEAAAVAFAPAKAQLILSQDAVESG